MLPGHKFSPEDILRIARDRWALVALPLAVGLAAALIVAGRLPDVYRSETLIMVVPQRIPDSYVKSTVTARIEDRLPSISDQILSRSRLERIIRDFDLYPQQRASGVMEDVVQRMRADIDVTLEGKDSFRVAYVSRDAATAQKVTGRLASLYIEENLRDRENLAESTNQFLEAQLEDAKRRLLEHEKKLEEYRRRYSGQLPSQVTSNLQVIQSAQLQLQSMADAVNRERERRLLLERQLADAQSPDPAPLVTTAEGSTPLESPAVQLETARSRLALLQTRYTPEHPDVVALKKVIRDLEAKAAADASGSEPGGAERLPTPAEAARQRKIRDLKAQIDDIDRQLLDKQTEERRLRSVIAETQAKVDVVPTRESELVELTRDYSTLQATYASLLAKREESKLSANLERRQIGEQFKILDAASLPEKPFNRSQKILTIAGGTFGGLLLGLVLVGLLEYRDSSFKAEGDVLRVLQLPVLALVPEMMSDRDRRKRRRRALLVRTATVLIALGSVAIAVFWRLRL